MSSQSIKPTAVFPEFTVLHEPESTMVDKIVGTLDFYNERLLGVPVRTQAIIAYMSGEYAGGIFYWFYPPDAVVYYMAVEEKWRRQGIGHQLLKKAEGEMQRAGCRQVVVDTMTFQAPQFYLSAGYKQIAMTPAYFGKSDRLTFRKSLGEFDG